MQARGSVASAGVSFHLQRKTSFLRFHRICCGPRTQRDGRPQMWLVGWRYGLTCRTELVATTFHVGSSGGRVKPGPIGLPHEGQVRPQSQGLRERA